MMMMMMMTMMVMMLITMMATTKPPYVGVLSNRARGKDSRAGAGVSVTIPPVTRIIYFQKLFFIFHYLVLFLLLFSILILNASILYRRD